VHDGIIAVEGLDMPTVIDSLVSSGELAPITAVFINSVDRHGDFAVGSMFSYVFTGELVPMIEERYALAPGARALLGFSRSSVGALDAGLNGSVAFHHLGLVAPAMNAATLAALVKAPRARPHVTVVAGTYDIPLIEDARALRETLRLHRIPHDWFDFPEGHNHTAWRAQLPRLLTAWFGNGARRKRIEGQQYPSAYSARSAAIGSTRIARRAGR
jgi:enterochelin esterase-like enzyme